jgi:hypothetical protein
LVSSSNGTSSNPNNAASIWRGALTEVKGVCGGGGGLTSYRRWVNWRWWYCDRVRFGGLYVQLFFDIYFLKIIL